MQNTEEDALRNVSVVIVHAVQFSVVQNSTESSLQWKKITKDIFFCLLQNKIKEKIHGGKEIMTEF